MVGVSAELWNLMMICTSDPVHLCSSKSFFFNLTWNWRGILKTKICNLTFYFDLFCLLDKNILRRLVPKLNHRAMRNTHTDPTVPVYSVVLCSSWVKSVCCKSTNATGCWDLHNIALKLSRFEEGHLSYFVSHIDLQLCICFGCQLSRLYSFIFTVVVNWAGR